MMGCASPYAYTRPTSGQIAAAEDAVHTARARGAQNDSAAAPFLTSAERELAAGKRSLDQGDNRNATWFLARAAADGELSHAMATKARAEADAMTTESQLSETRNSAGAPPPPPPPEAPRE
jgi:hypothetical protein